MSPCGARLFVPAGDEGNASDISYELDTQQVTLSMGCESPGLQHSSTSCPFPPLSPAQPVPGADLAVRSVSQLDMVVRASFTEQDPPFIPPGGIAPVQVCHTVILTHSFCSSEHFSGLIGVVAVMPV